MEEQKKAVIIGGGIIGAVSAYYLRQSGWAVTILERNKFGAGSSHGNCGLILPGHVLPLNIPGTIPRAMRWIFKKDAPLYIKPRFDLNLFKWMFKFARLCNEKHLNKAATARTALLKETISLYQNLINNENIGCDWEKCGVLFVFKTGEEFRAYESMNRIVKKYSEGADILNKKELLDLEPSLSEEIAGAWYEKGAAHFRPDFFMKAINRILVEQGVEIVEQSDVKSFNKNGNRILEAVTNKGNYTADEFVLATGAWTPILSRSLGCNVPIQPGKGYSITMSRPAAGPSIPCILEEVKVVATPWKSGYRLGGTMEFSGYDEELNKTRLNSIFKGTEPYFKDSDLNDVQEEWCGWRPMTYDGLPIIDRVPGLNNVMIAAGHNMVGLSMAPATGKLVAAILNNDTPKIDPAPYSMDRFSGF